jgi:quercetin dioxygenase-like cupin family protein
MGATDTPKSLTARVNDAFPRRLPIFSSGPFLARVRFPGGIDTPPHRHEAPFIDRNTVISGTLFVGFSETFDKSKGIAVPPGGVVAIPPGVAHFAWSEEETVVHVHGEGPWLPTA